MKDKEGNIATTEKEKARLITEYFKENLAPELKRPLKIYKNKKMNTPFTKEEIKEAVKSMKNGKAAGPDDIVTEFIKYSPEPVFEEIANIYNTAAESGEIVEEMQLGLLKPLQKPNKTKGPTENLRPIMLLSTLRKILTICMLRRLWSRFIVMLPKDQAAYQEGRGTTDQVFAIKILIEKAICSSDYELYLM